MKKVSIIDLSSRKKKRTMMNNAGHSRNTSIVRKQAKLNKHNAKKKVYQ